MCLNKLLELAKSIMVSITLLGELVINVFIRPNFALSSQIVKNNIPIDN